jgi:hypothetical protein
VPRNLGGERFEFQRWGIEYRMIMWGGGPDDKHMSLLGILVTYFRAGLALWWTQSLRGSKVAEPVEDQPRSASDHRGPRGMGVVFGFL